MSDLISRQAAIDAVVAEGRNVDSRYLESERIIHESDAVEAIAMLPSAQPEVAKDTNVPSNDCISRQDAIDIIEKAIDFWDGQIGCGALVVVKNRLGGLPSAEKHGHWIYKNGAMVSPWYSSYECSECGCLSGYFKYCPECGSRNRGEEEQ